MDAIEGSPYLNENFQAGIAKVEGKEPLSVFLRYNVPQDQMEIKLDLQSAEVYELPKNNKTHYKVGSQTFVFDMLKFEGSVIGGYFIELYSGEKFRLLEKPIATLTEAIKAKTGYDKDRPAQIKLEEEYFVVKEDGQVLNVRLKHKDIKNAFDSEPSKEYLSDNKIRSEEDLKSFISWLDKQ